MQSGGFFSKIILLILTLTANSVWKIEKGKYGWEKETKNADRKVQFKANNWIPKNPYGSITNCQMD